MRDSDFFRNRFKVLVETLLRWLVVIRSDLQRRVGSLFFCPTSQPERFGGAVRARTGHDFAPAGGELNHLADYTLVFIVSQRRGFTGCSDRNQKVRTRRNLEFNLRFKPRNV